MMLQIFEESGVVNLSRKKRCRIVKDMKATKLPDLSEHNKEKCVSWANKYNKQISQQ